MLIRLNDAPDSAEKNVILEPNIDSIIKSVPFACLIYSFGMYCIKSLYSFFAKI